MGKSVDLLETTAPIGKNIDTKDIEDSTKDKKMMSISLLQGEKISDTEYTKLKGYLFNDVIKEEAKNFIPTILDNISAEIDTYLDSCLEQSFFKDHRKVCVNGVDCPLSDVKSPKVTKEEFRNMLDPFKEDYISFISYLNHFLKKHLMQSLLVQLTLIYGILEVPDDDLDDYTVDCKNPIDDLFKEYKKILDAAGVKKDKAYFSRLKKKFKEVHDVCESIPVGKIVRTVLKKQRHYHSMGIASHPNSLLHKDFRRRFTLDHFVASRSFLLATSNSVEDSLDSLPISFSAYIGFVAQYLTQKHTLYSHCEAYKDRMLKHDTHNKYRSYDNITRKYNEYVEGINQILSGLIKSESTNIADIACAEFLLNETFLHHRFFSALDCDFFTQISSSIDWETVHNDNYNETSSDFYYTLIKLLWFFNIDIKELNYYAFEEEESLSCDSLGEITLIDKNLHLPVEFLCDYLKEVFNSKGDILNQCQESFYAMFSDLDVLRFSERLNSLTAYFSSNYKEWDFLTPVSNEPSDLPALSFSKDKALLITHLIHLSGTEPLLI